MKHFVRLTLAAICSILSLAFWNQPNTYAAGSDTVVSINPSEQTLEFKPGKTYSSSVTIYNLGNDPFDFDVYAAPYQVKSDGDTYDADFSTENNYTKITSWIAFEQTEYHLEPGTATEVKFAIVVPQGIMGGGQYAAIIIRTRPSDGSSVNIVSQLASIVYGHVSGGEMIEEGEMLEQIFPSIFWGSDFRIGGIFKNSGNVDYRVTASMEIREFFTNREIITPDTTSSEGCNVGHVASSVLPATTRTITLHWPDAPQIGFYKVKLNISYLDQKIEEEKVVFLCPIWLVILVGIIIVLIVLWIISAIKNKRADKPQVY